jgi:hypothetical protein
MATTRSILSILGCTLILLACADRPSDWTEEVLSVNGTVVTLTRHHEYRNCGMIGHTSPSCPGDYWFELRHPITHQTVRWEQDQNHLATVALILQGHSDVYLLTTPALGGTDRYYGCPDPGYILWKHNPGITKSAGVADSWFRVPLNQAPFQTVDANMTYGGPPRNTAHLDVSNTKDQFYGQNPQKWVINLLNAPLQTFDSSNCDKPRDKLLLQSAG